MARDDNSVINQVFAGSAGAGDAVEPTSIMATGWPATYEDPASGLFPEREFFNWLYRGVYSLGKELNSRGLLEWNALCDYVHPAICMGSDGKIYQSLQSSGASSPKDPTNSANATYWRDLTVAQADRAQTLAPEIFTAQGSSAGVTLTIPGVTVGDIYYVSAQGSFSLPGSGSTSDIVFSLDVEGGRGIRFFNNSANFGPAYGNYPSTTFLQSCAIGRTYALQASGIWLAHSSSVPLTGFIASGTTVAGQAGTWGLKQIQAILIRKGPA